METNKYIPCPRDTHSVELPESLKELSEAMASNEHELWAYEQYIEGWRYASEGNDKSKKTPDMVPYSELSNSEKKTSLATTATEVLKFIYLNGYEIQKRDTSSKNRVNYNPVRGGWKVVTVILIFLSLLIVAFIAWGAIKVCTGAFPSSNEVYMSIIYLVIACVFLFGITKIVLKLIALFADVLHKDHQVLSELYAEEQKKEIIRRSKNKI
ncbi:RyR domain-containing protein [Bacteroides sp.]|uniref:RyR domain-containing protein n=1 Tax=Bacteroides sp. TaxID=29523 RepID=UPI002603F611|nr:RyR domain-containing protein [Bacteroides sp.]MDD3036964.1 RyR domain-containing protein [Bacteroides sp.]